MRGRCIIHGLTTRRLHRTRRIESCSRQTQRRRAKACRARAFFDDKPVLFICRGRFIISAVIIVVIDDGDGNDGFFLFFSKSFLIFSIFSSRLRDSPSGRPITIHSVRYITLLRYPRTKRLRARIRNTTIVSTGTHGRRVAHNTRDDAHTKRRWDPGPAVTNRAPESRPHLRKNADR